MPSYRITTVATLLGVSDDTIRRWLDEGSISADTTQSGPTRIDGESIVRFLQARPEVHRLETGRETQSIRNQLQGLVLAIKKDSVMTQVDLQCGPYRVVSLISTESAEELGIEVGSIAVAQTKATNVSIQLLSGDKL